MRMTSLVWSWATCLSLLAIRAAALPTISAKGTKFYTSDGDQFFVKGIAYQIGVDDTLLDTAQCMRDAALMKTIGTNTIRVYHVTEPHDHSGCMKAFEDAGIYVFLDLDTFSTAIDQFHPEWTPSQAHAFEAVMDEFQKYDNTAGFFIGNEVLTMPSKSEAAPFIKAAARDMKVYRDSMGYRDIPIGYSHADIPDLRPTLQNYLACGSVEEDTIDFFGLNAYEWCGPNTFEGSGYANLTNEIKSYPKPVIMSETGCITVPPRTFQDQHAIFGPQMTPYWSGAIIYEWIQEQNFYGLVAYNADDTTASVTTATSFARSGTPLPVTPDFSNLKQAWAAVQPSSTPEAAYHPTVTPPPCPAFTEGVWEVAGNVVLPTLGEKLSRGSQFSITAGGHPKSTASTTSTTPSSSTSSSTTAHHTTTTSTTSSRTSHSSRSSTSSSSSSSHLDSTSPSSTATHPRSHPHSSVPSPSHSSSHSFPTKNPLTSSTGHAKGQPRPSTTSTLPAAAKTGSSQQQGDNAGGNAGGAAPRAAGDANVAVAMLVGAFSLALGFVCWL